MYAVGLRALQKKYAELVSGVQKKTSAEGDEQQKIEQAENTIRECERL